jgi:serine/threonine-protein kinase
MRASAGRYRRQYQFSGFRLDVAARQLFGPDGAALPVTSKAVDVLAYLVEHDDRVVDKDELLAAVWTGRVVEENNVTQAVSALRKAFGVGAGEHRFIVTVSGRGYRFVGQPTASSFAQMRRAGDTAEPHASAERLYLAGRDLVDAPSISRCKRAIGLFRQALDLDPLHARAWCGQAFAWRTLTIVGDTAPSEALPLARAAVRHALALDPGLSQAHAEHAFNLFWGDWDWTGAERECKHAIALDPHEPDGYFVYAHLLNNLGRFSEALVLARRARELDPLSPLVNALEGGFLAAAGRTREADARIAQALEIAPDFWIALLARAGMTHARGDAATALGVLDQAAALSGRCSQVLAVLGRVLVAAGDRAGAEALREELRTLSTTAYVPGTSRAAISNALGYQDEALDLLELAFEQRDVRMTFLGINARWNNLRALPRFEALMKRLGLTGAAANGFL